MAMLIRLLNSKPNSGPILGLHMRHGFNVGLVSVMMSWDHASVDVVVAENVHHDSYDKNMRAQVGILLSFSYYILEVPCFVPGLCWVYRDPRFEAHTGDHRIYYEIYFQACVTTQ